MYFFWQVCHRDLHFDHTHITLQQKGFNKRSDRSEGHAREDPVLTKTCSRQRNSVLGLLTNPRVMLWTRRAGMTARARMVVGLCAGLFLGFTLASWLVVQRADPPRGGSLATRVGCRRDPTAAEVLSSGAGDPGGPASTPKRESAGPERGKNLVYVGVMTAKKYLDSRAVAAYETWQRHIPGKVEFYSAYDPTGSSPGGLSRVNIPGVDDAYPPQKKSFLMLKYMHDHYLDQYDWFMRADDDVYIKGDKLENFLRGVNATRPLYIGQTGLGNAEEFGRLSLDAGENFCMGGPGMIMSRETLRRMVPNISWCLKHLYTTHEDVEIGRCIQKFTGVSCTWAYESQHLFFNDYKNDKKGRIENLHTVGVQRAITMHPNKHPPYQYRLHNYLLSQRMHNLRQRTLSMHREVKVMSHLLLEDVTGLDAKLGDVPSLMHFTPRETAEVLTWQYLNNRQVYAAKDLQPRQAIPKAQRAGLDDIIMQMMEMINRHSRTRGRIIDYKDIQYGYWRVNPMYGAEYVLDLLLLYRKHKGKKINVPVRRHAYLQQAFSHIQFMEEETIKNGRSSQSDRAALGNVQKHHLVDKSRTADLSSIDTETVHFIIPLVGRLQTLKQFLENYERTCLRTKEKVKLLIVLFKSRHKQQQDQSSEIRKLLGTYQDKYPTAHLRILFVAGEFSRGLGLELGASQFTNTSLLFFCDVDLVFQQSLLQRIRAKTIMGQQAYYPIVFSQYDPSVVHRNSSVSIRNNFLLTKDTGYWRFFGFGTASLYAADFIRVGQFDTSIQGWGMEDVDLFDKFVHSDIKTFRVKDPGLVHVFHPQACDTHLEEKQYQMCLGTKAGTYGSAAMLSKLWLERHPQRPDDSR
ncbi:chondroitin sulfate synthase 1-like isoform X1 [Branchiostoma lanceolatum]|uniref:chondroitin sulfate synthase 1-like isoform X1 n=1 Tax=Branchiostoma lanceolatum TaxID=7740 RepID=UPI0034563DF9